MSYYKERRKAQVMIRDMLLQKCSVDEIKFKVANHFGFSEKFVDKYLDLLRRNSNAK